MAKKLKYLLTKNKWKTRRERKLINRPNIVLISVDQMRRDCLGISDHAVVETPNLDMMRLKGYQFTNAYSAVPSCIPARAALLTGQSQKKHRRVGYEDGISWDYKNTLAQELTNVGYHTQCIGKMHVYPERNLCGFHNIVLHDGYLQFDRDTSVPQEKSHQNNDDYLVWLKRNKGADADLLDSGLECNSWVARPFLYEEQYHPTNWCVSESIDFLRRRDSSKPFFLYTSFVRPHSPLDPPQHYYNLYNNMQFPQPIMGDWANKNDDEQNGLHISTKKGVIPPNALHRARAAYYGHISHIDNQIGRLFQAMAEYRLMENTVFVFVSDHGDMLGDHNLFRKALPYEGSAGVPLLVYDPGNLLKAKQNKKINCLAELRDIMPTLLDIAGAQVPQEVDGLSLVPVMCEETNQVREYLHGEHSYDEASNHFIVTPKDKYIWYSQTGKEQYFDLENDPQELCDLILCQEAQERISLLKNYLIKELKDREEGYTDGEKLFIGKTPVNMLGMK